MDRLLCGVMITGLLLSVGLLAVQAQSAEEGIASGDNNTLCTGTAVNGTIVLTPSLNVTTCNITVERLPSSTFTAIHFSRLDLQEGDDLTIYDGSEILLNVTGSRDSLMVVVASPQAFLVVHIKSNLSSSVLQATYTSGCSIQQTVNSTSLLQSPVYLPNKVAFSCSYVVSQAASTTNSRLALSFVEVALPNATLYITSPSPGINVTGASLPPDVYGSKMQMVLTVPKVNAVQKFSAAVSPVISSSVCGHVIKVGAKQTFNLMVPATHPLPYDCRVTLKADNGMSLWLNITSLQLAGHGDSVEVVDGGALAANTLLASFSSDTSGYLVLSGQKQVLVRLVLGLVEGKRSLVADVKAMEEAHHLYNEGKFSLRTPAGSAMVSQYYVLESPSNSAVRLTLSGQMANEMVSVYDGDQTSSPLLVTFSSAGQLGVPVVSSGHKVLVVARLTNTSQSLNASFSSQAPGCDKITSASEGSFQLMTLPTVPSKCVWTVTAPPSSDGTILLDLTSVKLSQKATLSVYSGVVGSGGTVVAQLTNVDTLSSAPLPAVAVSASQWAQVVWSSGNSTNLTSVAVNVRFQLLDSLCGGQIQASNGHLRSPAFPNLYPLNTLCQWTFQPSKPGRLLLFDFPQFQLAQNHSLVIAETRNSTSHQVASFNSSSAQLPDVLYASNVTNTVTFSAQLPKSVVVSNQVAQGFDIQYWTLNCGGFMNQSSGSFSSPDYPSQIPVSPANATLCVWFVQLASKTGKDLNAMNMTLQIKETGSPSVTDLVKVYDGKTLRDGLIAFNFSKGATSTSFLSRYNSVLVVFNITAKGSSLGADKSQLAIRVNYTTYSCNKTFQCANGGCMLPGWRCNRINDCGDGSDEANCGSQPLPQPGSKNGMKPGIVVLLFFVGLLLGILLAVIIPRIIRRFRTNRYTSFRDEPAVA